MTAITKTNFSFPGQTGTYVGKVRDVYTINNDRLVMVTTDRISAFDVVLPKGIPYKGQVLSQITAGQLEATADIVPNWLKVVADPNALIGLKCQVFKVEIIIRGYLVGSAWRAYSEGTRELCGVLLPEGMKENQKFDAPIITPTTKADKGHDENISPAEIVNQRLMTQEEWKTVSDYAFRLFERGTDLAAKQGLLLIDTKYEFGKRDGKIYLIDEIHTPDSSRYFYADGYEERFRKGNSQHQLSKEFVREWLMEHDFAGKKDQTIPDIPDEFVTQVSERYIELYQKLMGKKFQPAPSDNATRRIEDNVVKALKKTTN